MQRLAIRFAVAGLLICALARAAAAEDDIPARSPTAQSDHWAFQPVRRPQLPEVPRGEPTVNPIDAFIRARLEADRITPSPDAARATLLRRVFLDVVGVPPSADETRRFLDDQSPDSYERLVDRLLASPRYGERWGRHWLDLARYADSDGYTIDGPRSIWKYRAWVIDALNRDLPFDRFAIEQLAGDMLPEATQDQVVATGFHRNTLINKEGGTDQEQFRVEAVVDRVATTGSVFLGLTMGCARCHDHKFEPLTQRDFYGMFAFFNNCDEPQIEAPTAEQAALRAELRPKISALEKQLRARAILWSATQERWEAQLTDNDRAELPGNVRAALAVMPEERDDEARKLISDHYLARDARRKKLSGEMAALEKRLPSVAKTLVLRERSEPRTTHVLIRGDFLRPGEPITPAVPAVLPAVATGEDHPPSRLDFARWLVDERNPLTARVTVNRIWQRYFGRGLVETEDDFGIQGSPPSHPALLDWLASELIERDWSLKAIHRLIVTSATYCQSSDARPDLAEIDPRNRLLARQLRTRLDAEVIRDSALAAAGLLAEKVGGPSVFPHQPAGVMQLAQVNRPWKVSPGEDRYRRSLYTYFWRSTPHPFLKTFDSPDGVTSCTRRNESNTPLQSLTLLNDAEFNTCADAVARRAMSASLNSDEQRARYIFGLCLVREPSQFEVMRLVDLVDAERRAAMGDAAAAVVATTSTAAISSEGVTAEADGEIAEAYGTNPSRSAQDIELAAWTAAARVLLNVDEFVTRE